MGEFPEAPKADDVAVVAFEDSALRHVEADGALEGGNGDDILMLCVVCTRRLHNYQLSMLLRFAYFPLADKESSRV